MNKLFQKLDERRFFKLILGLGNIEVESIKKLSAVYAKAGAEMFDLTPDEEVFEAVLDGITSQNLNNDDFFYCVSFSIGNDKHGNKASIDNEKCVLCLKCIENCPYSAISFDEISKQVFVTKKKCIGCRKCECTHINYKKQDVDIVETVDRLKSKYKIDCIELHISTSKTRLSKDIFKKVRTKFPEIPVSVCISREKFSDKKLVKFLSKLIKLNEDCKLIIQADGTSMNGGGDDFSSTLQAVAIADLMKDLNAYILLSGGTNLKTAALAKQCSVEISGISIGSFGRLLLSNEVNDEEFWYNKNVLNSALNKAKMLVDSVKNQ